MFMRIANFRCPIADLALKKENLKFKLSNRKSKYYLLPFLHKIIEILPAERLKNYKNPPLQA